TRRSSSVNSLSMTRSLPNAGGSSRLEHSCDHPGHCLHVARHAWYGQCGPRFRTDDPGTPGNKHWEINLGLIRDRNPSGGSYSLPNFDINYGLGDRVQLKYEFPLAVRETRGTGENLVGGLGNSLFGFKYRSFEHRPRDDTRRRRAQISPSRFIPSLLSANPTRSVSREIVEPGPQFLAPVEAAARIGPVKIVAETGYWFTNRELS